MAIVVPMAITRLPISSAAAGHIGPASESELAPALAIFCAWRGRRAHLPPDAALPLEALGDVGADAAETAAEAARDLLVLGKIRSHLTQAR